MSARRRRWLWYVAAPFLLVLFWLAGFYVSKCFIEAGRYGYCP